jgi:hypothetical protein
LLLLQSVEFPSSSSSSSEVEEEEVGRTRTYLRVIMRGG